jgi:hypothetical protein
MHCILAKTAMQSVVNISITKFTYTRLNNISMIFAETLISNFIL